LYPAADASGNGSKERCGTPWNPVFDGRKRRFLNQRTLKFAAGGGFAVVARLVVSIVRKLSRLQQRSKFIDASGAVAHDDPGL
jgi:hypothetical protein